MRDRYRKRDRTILPLSDRLHSSQPFLEIYVVVILIEETRKGRILDADHTTSMLLDFAELGDDGQSKGCAAFRLSFAPGRMAFDSDSLSDGPERARVSQAVAWRR
jgi:hypothetical protein